MDKLSVQEFDAWTARIGEQFSVGKAAFGNQRARLKMTLVDVVPMTKPDPDRPRSMRTPYTLLFKPNGKNIDFESATYHVNGRSIRRQSMFLNETMCLEHSDQPVLQAVFG